MTALLNFPQKQSKFNRLMSLGTPFLGRKKGQITATAADITNTLGVVPKQSGITQYIDSIYITALPSPTTLSLTANTKLRITDGTTNNNKDLTFLVPTDMAGAVTAIPTRQFKLSPGGRMALSPGYKIQALSNTTEIYASAFVSGSTVHQGTARDLGVPIAKDLPITLDAGASGTTLNANLTSLKSSANGLAGKSVRVIYSTTATILNQVRTVISNTVTVDDYVDVIVIDEAFSTDPESGAVLEVMEGDFWISGVVISDTTRKPLIGGIPRSNAGRGKCVQILGWYFTGLNDAAGANESNVRLYFGDRTEQSTGTSATGNALRTVTRWHLSKGTSAVLASGTSTSTSATVLTDTGATLQTNALTGFVLEYTAGAAAGQRRAIVSNTGTTITTAAFSPAPGQTDAYVVTASNGSYFQDGVDDCEITGPPGYGLTAVGSGTALTSTASVIVWGRYVDEDAHHQYNPHGVPHGTYEALGSTGSITRFLASGEKATVTTGGVSTTITCDGSKLVAGPPATGWADGIYVGAYVTILSGSGASMVGQTRRITGITGATGVITVDRAITTVANDVVVISGFGGEKFWFCYDQASSDTANAQAFFGMDQTALSASQISGITQNSFLQIDGVVGSGALGATGYTAVSNGAGLTGILFLMNGFADMGSHLNLQRLGAIVVPDLIAPADMALTTGLGIVTTDSASSTITVWGRRINGTIAVADTTPLVQGS